MGIETIHSSTEIKKISIFYHQQKHEGSGKEKEQRLVDLGVSIRCPTSDTGSVK
jgi:hypothetical protein